MPWSLWRRSIWLPPCDQDDDGDGFPDCEDECPYVYGEGPTGCPEVKRKKWHFDGNGDGFHSKVVESNENPGQGWSLGTSGIDCDDMKPLVWKLNKCKKCEPEPKSTDWDIDDLTNNASGLLKELLDKAREIQPNLTITKDGNHSGANTNINCGEIHIGRGVNSIESASILAFELSHIVNNNSDLALNAVFALTKNDFLEQRATFEAQGKVFSKIIKTEQSQELNDCEKNKLGGFNSLENDYTGQSVDDIINSIEQNGDLANETQNVLNGNVPSSEKSFTNHFGPIYDEWQRTIKHYRDIENETNETIRDRFTNDDCN